MPLANPLENVLHLFPRWDNDGSLFPSRAYPDTRHILDIAFTSPTAVTLQPAVVTASCSEEQRAPLFLFTCVALAGVLLHNVKVVCIFRHPPWLGCLGKLGYPYQNAILKSFTVFKGHTARANLLQAKLAEDQLPGHHIEAEAGPLEMHLCSPFPF
jgi:hypothetical protein